MKISAEFLPKSWEMPPDARLIEDSASVLTRNFGDETLDWLVALVEIPAYKNRITWARPLNSDSDAGFVIFNFDQYRVWECNQLTTNAENHFNSFVEADRIARHFFLNRHGQLRHENELAYEAILVAADGIAAWSLDAILKESHDATAFCWESPLPATDFSRLSALTIWKQFQSSLADPNSEASCARRFALMNERQRLSLIFDETQVNATEGEILLRALIHSAYPLNSNVYACIDLNGEFFLLDENDLELYIPDDLLASAGLIWKRCKPMNPDIAKHPFVFRWLQRQNFSSVFLNVLIYPPTAHEQLEAQLRWRQWLSQTQKQI